jgi:hypothetical protein
MRLLDYASLGRCIPWTVRPLHDGTLNDVSRVPTLDDGVEVLAVTNQFRFGNVAYGHLTSQTDWTHKMLVKLIDSFASTASTHRLREALSQGHIIQRTQCPIDLRYFFIRGHTSEGRNNIAQRCCYHVMWKLCYQKTSKLILAGS